MAGRTGTYDEDQLDPELKNQAGVLGRNAGDEIWAKQQTRMRSMVEPFGNVSGGLPEQPALGGIKAPEVRKMSPLELPGRAERFAGNVKYPTQPETRFTSGESSIGPIYTGDQPAIPERTTPTEGPPEEGWTRRPGEGIDYKITQEGTPVGREAQRRGLEERSTARMGEMRDVAKGEMIRSDEEARRKREENAPPGEFDFNDYKRAISGLGGTPDMKMKMAVLGHMMGAHDKKTEAYNKWKELNMTYGPGSAHMKTAEAEAQYKNILGQKALDMAPHEIAKSIEDRAHTKALTAAIPYDVAYKQSETEYRKSLINLKEFTAESGYMKILSEKIEKGIATDPEVIKAQKTFDEIVQNKRGEMLVERWIRNNPQDKGKVGWDGQKLIEIGKNNG